MVTSPTTLNGGVKITMASVHVKRSASKIKTVNDRALIIDRPHSAESIFIMSFVEYETSSRLLQRVFHHRLSFRRRSLLYLAQGVELAIDETL